MGRAITSTGLRTRTLMAFAAATATGLALLAGTSWAAEPGAGPVLASAAAVKAPIVGLIDRQGVPPLAARSYIRAYVVKVNWADLQPTPYGPIAANNAIDQAIVRVRKPDLAGRVALKLRVFAGVNAPEWAKEIGGAPLPYVNNQDGSVTSGTIGRFWLPEFGAAYDDLQAKLAALYDAVPEIREVTVSRCSTIFDEMFVRQPLASNVAVLQAAGYTVDADKQCIQDAIDEHQVWQQTTSDVSFSPFPDVFDGGVTDVAYTDAVMDACRAALGARCGLENNGLSLRRLGIAQFQQMFAHMAQLGGEVTFQTASKGRIGDWPTVLDAAVRDGASSVELPKGYTSWSPQSLLAQYGAELAAP
jgi:hypothetical protein